MSKFPFIPQSYDNAGDDNRYLWSTRLPEDTHQRLLDVSSEYHLSKAETMRQLVFFALECIAKEETQLSTAVRNKIIADTRRKGAIQKQDQRLKAHRHIIDLLTRAAIEETAAIKAELTLAAKGVAKAWYIDYPPPGLPFIAIDKDAAYVYKRIKSIAEEKNTSAIRLNELNPRIHDFNADQLRDVLKQLEKHDYVELSEERTSGPPTLWITLPVLPMPELVNS